MRPSCVVGRVRARHGGEQTVGAEERGPVVVDVDPTIHAAVLRDVVDDRGVPGGPEEPRETRRERHDAVVIGRDHRDRTQRGLFRNALAVRRPDEQCGRTHQANPVDGRQCCGQTDVGGLCAIERYICVDQTGERAAQQNEPGKVCPP